MFRQNKTERVAGWRVNEIQYSGRLNKILLPLNVLHISVYIQEIIFLIKTHARNLLTEREVYPDVTTLQLVTTNQSEDTRS